MAARELSGHPDNSRAALFESLPYFCISDSYFTRGTFKRV